MSVCAGAGGGGVGEAASGGGRGRAARIEEIKGTARQLLVDEGPDAVWLRAIGRAMGMTAPALYRYFGNREDLLQHVCGDIFTESAADIHAEIGGAAEGLSVGHNCALHGHVTADVCTDLSDSADARSRAG